MGVLFAMISAIGFALTYVLIRKGVRPDDPDNGLMITMLINVLILCVASVALWMVVPPPELLPGAVAWFVVAGLLGPLVGRNALFGGIRRIGSGRAAAIKNNAPVVTVVTAVVFLGEELTLQAIAGATLVTSGLLLLAYEAFAKGPSGPQPEHDEPVGWVLEPDAAAEGASGGAAAAIESVRRQLHSPALAGIGLGVIAAVAFGLSQVARKVAWT